MTPYYQEKGVTIYHGDCRELLPDKASAIVTDPPYELGFMGKSWDSKGISFQKETWQIIRKSCLSGAPLLSLGGTRTFHRIACAIEDAGWEIRDTLMWVYGSGFPKSLDISKAIDKQAGVEREIVRIRTDGNKGGGAKTYDDDSYVWDKPFAETRAATPEAQLWEGYGTALKPAYEPIILAMNPLDGTFANNALKHGVAGLNIDGCRVEINIENEPDEGSAYYLKRGQEYPSKFNPQGSFPIEHKPNLSSKGRFPANFIHDGSQQVMELFPETSTHGGGTTRTRGIAFSPVNSQRREPFPVPIGDSGSAARFFYCAKSSKAERNKGCEELEDTLGGSLEGGNDKRKGDKPQLKPTKNFHPTVKPLALMEYLVKLVKMPEYNLIIDPFCGSGTTLLACIRLGIPCIGIDNDEKSCEIAAKRCSQMELKI